MIFSTRLYVYASYLSAYYTLINAF